jgi:hypothetical protein
LVSGIEEGKGRGVKRTKNRRPKNVRRPIKLMGKKRRRQKPGGRITQQRALDKGAQSVGKKQ